MWSMGWKYCATTEVKFFALCIADIEICPIMLGFKNCPKERLKASALQHQLERHWKQAIYLEDPEPVSNRYQSFLSLCWK